jgi:hypothetical protein
VSDYLRTPNGFLVAYDSGEWGGGLSWFDEAGAFRQAIMDENTSHILETPDGILALTGLAHMTHDAGHVVQLTFDEARWSTHKVELPGAPKAALLEPDGALFVATSDHLVRVERGPRVTVLHQGTWGGLYPNSLVRDASGTFYLGMRYVVARLRRTEAGYSEEWLTPNGVELTSNGDAS